METGTLVEPGRYRLTLSPQYIMSGDKGFNISSRFDLGLTDELSMRFLLGGGEVNVFLGTSFKWVPIPDVDNQPAFGLIGSVTYGDYMHHDIVTVRLAPIVSKMFETEFGQFTPYTSLPFGIASYAGQTDSPVNLVLGSELKTFNFEDVKFLMEFGIKLNDDSFSYVTFGAAWDF